jgi:hypothetical protein
MLPIGSVRRAQRGFLGQTGLIAFLYLATQPAHAQSVPPSDEVIADPELAAVAPTRTASAAPPPTPNGEVRVVLRSRLGLDLAWQDPREDVWEATQIALFEARVRRSEHLRFEVGVRARHLFAARAHHTADADAERYELDAAPTAAFADIGLGHTVHLRLGYQTMRLGRFDVLNPSDILSVYDLRSGPTTMPEASDIAQPALRVDWDATGFLSLSVIALPFFEPHRVNTIDGDYALSLTRQGADSTMTSAPAGTTAGPERLVRETLSRSGQSRLGEGALSAFAPEPNLAQPQAAMRLLMHGSDGELGLTAGTALEHLPALRYSKAFLDYVRDSSGANTDALLAESHPIEVLYNRFGVTSLDAATALGPLQIGAEVAYIFGRTLFAAEEGELPQAAQSDMLHAGVRVEYAQSDALLFAVEATAARGLHAPSDSAKRWMFLTRDRLMLSAAGFLAYTPGDVGLTLELGGGFLNGPSYLLVPRVEQRLATGFYAEAGLHVLAGKAPGPAGDPGLALGGLYGDADQVFIGLRFQP